MLGRTRRIVVSAFLAAVVLSMAVVGGSSADDPAPNQPVPEPQAPEVPPSPPTKHSKFSSSIAQLVEASKSVPQGVPLTAATLYTAKPPMDGYLMSGLLNLDDLGRAQV